MNFEIFDTNYCVQFSFSVWKKIHFFFFFFCKDFTVWWQQFKHLCVWMQTEIKYWKTTSLGEMQNIDRYLITLQQQYQNWLNHFNVYQQRDQEREEEEKKSIYEDLFHNKGERALITLTRFDNLEFDEIYKACKLVLRIPGQGRNHSLFPKDMLLVTLTYLASGSKFNLIAQMFNWDESLVYRTIHFTVRQITRPLVAKFCVMPIQLKPDEPHFSSCWCYWHYVHSH